MSVTVALRFSVSYWLSVAMAVAVVSPAAAMVIGELPVPYVSVMPASRALPPRCWSM